MNKKWLKKSMISVAVMSMALGTAITANAAWKQENGNWYYENAAGVKQTGWYNDNGTWYFMNSSGVMLTGVIEVDGKVYYFNQSGALVVGKVDLNGKSYTFDLYGINEKLAPSVTGRYYGNGHVVVKSSGSSSSSSRGSSNNGGSGQDNKEEQVKETVTNVVNNLNEKPALKDVVDISVSEDSNDVVVVVEDGSKEVSTVSKEVKNAADSLLGDDVATVKYGTLEAGVSVKIAKEALDLFLSENSDKALATFISNEYTIDIVYKDGTTLTYTINIEDIN